MEIEILKSYWLRLMDLDMHPRCKVRMKPIMSISVNLVVILTVANAVSIHRSLVAVCAEVGLFF